MVEPLPCDVCGAVRWEPVSHRDRRGDSLETALCQTCGLVRHLRVPSEEELATYYREIYRQDYHGEEAPSVRRVVRAWRRGQALFERLRAYVPQGGVVFEVGAGLGLNLKPFQLSGRAARGVEPNRAWRTFARERLGVELDEGRLEELRRRQGYDLVVVAHVIEHLRSPRAGLERLASLLRPGGRIYVECPNVAAPFAPPARLFHRAHIHNFSAGTLRMLAGACGLRVERAFASDDDPTVALLLAPDAGARLQLEPDNLRRTRAALATGWVGYHLRPGYVSLRLLKLRERLSEMVGGERAYREILERCGE